MGSKQFKPMLAETAPEDLSEIVFPVLASPKLDGIRALVYRSELVRRSLKKVPNLYIHEGLNNIPDGLDGELISPGGFSATQSFVMSQYKKGDFTFWVFDDFSNPELPFNARLAAAQDKIKPHRKIDIVEHVIVNDVAELVQLEKKYLSSGYEGVMIRKIDGEYKFGRSTLKEGGLLKLKQFTDAEALVIGFKERQHNLNPKTTNALGESERSMSKANMVPAGDLGALICLVNGVEFDVGSGFDADTRIKLWAVRDNLIGKTITFSYQKDSNNESGLPPRFPVFLRFREPE